MMKKIFKFSIAVALIAIVLTMFATISTAAESIDIELTTRSILLIDKSASMAEQQKLLVDSASYDAIVYFADRLSLSDEEVGKNSHICEMIDQVAKSGFTHITILTDGQQWPADYTALSVYTDLDLTIHLVGNKKEASQEFISELKGKLVNSTLKVVTPDGREVIVDDYQAPIYTIELPLPSEPEEQPSVEKEEEEDNIKEGYFPWWIVLILATLVAGIFDFIHELITHNRVDTNPPPADEDEASTSPMPAKAVAQIAMGAKVVADYSGSMAAQQAVTAETCQQVGSSEAVTCFGDTVFEVPVDKLCFVKAAGQTAGWEALEKLSEKGWDVLVVVSDLKFNGKAFDQKVFAQKFKKITVVTPRGYDRETLENLKKIADEVEVLPLQ